jgi:hypothetical protein
VESVDACRCEPSNVACQLSPFPVCDGDCPPGTVCVPDPSGVEQCVCEPIPCEQAPFPTCDGECPPGTTCATDPTGDLECVCEPDVACEQTIFPDCDGACPPDEQCVNVVGTDNCRCEPLDPPLCRDTFFPLCDGACPPDERCTPGGPDDPCRCVPCDIIVPDDDIYILFPSKTLLDWTGGTCASFFNVYRTTVQRLPDADSNGLADDYGSCFQPMVFVSQATDTSSPAATYMHAYLVTGENAAGEGGMGFNSSLVERPNLSPCP